MVVALLLRDDCGAGVFLAGHKLVALVDGSAMLLAGRR